MEDGTRARLLSAGLGDCCQAKVVYPYLFAKHNDFMSTSPPTNGSAQRKPSNTKSLLRSPKHRQNICSRHTILGILLNKSHNLWLFVLFPFASSSHFSSRFLFKVASFVSVFRISAPLHQICAEETFKQTPTVDVIRLQNLIASFNSVVNVPICWFPTKH